MSGRAVTMWQALVAIGTSEGGAVYERFIRERSAEGDHGFLLSAIRSSNLREPHLSVAIDLITGKLKRPRRRPHKKDLVSVQMRRALAVLDLERTGDWKSQSSREAAVLAAAKYLGCGKRSVQTALSLWENALRGADADFLEMVRAIKSAT